MTTSILDTTQETCTICHIPYQKGEISDVTKVVESACHHFYHIGCISQSLIHQRNTQTKLTCNSCAQEIVPLIQVVGFPADQEIFQAKLKEVKEEYDYDDKVMEAIPVVESLYTSLRDLLPLSPLESNQGDPKEIFVNTSKFIIENEAIRGDLKTTVLQIISYILTGDRVLRTIQGEADRWRMIPFENWPEKLKEKGVLVDYKYNNTRIPIRISANHLRKESDRLCLDFFLDHICSRVSWILGGIVVAVLAKRVLGRL